jgi:ArsR family transcriptional regulator
MFQDIEIMKLYKNIFIAHAEICKTLANPKRLEILNALSNGEITVNDLVKKLRLPKANISQHLSVLRTQGVVLARRSGRNIYYKIASPKIIKACNLMREVLIEKIKRGQKILTALKEEK